MGICPADGLQRWFCEAVWTSQRLNAVCCFFDAPDEALLIRVNTAASELPMPNPFKGGDHADAADAGVDQHGLLRASAGGGASAAAGKRAKSVNGASSAAAARLCGGAIAARDTITDSTNRSQPASDQAVGRRALAGSNAADQKPAAAHTHRHAQHDADDTSSSTGSSPRRRADLDARCRSFLAKLAARSPAVKLGGDGGGAATHSHLQPSAASRQHYAVAAAAAPCERPSSRAEALDYWRQHHHQTRTVSNSGASSLRDLAAAADEDDQVVIAPDHQTEASAVEACAGWQAAARMDELQHRQQQQWMGLDDDDDDDDNDDEYYSGSDEEDWRAVDEAVRSAGVCARQLAGDTRTARPHANLAVQPPAAPRMPALAGLSPPGGRASGLWSCSPANALGALHLEETSIIDGVAAVSGSAAA